ncbi:MAG: quinonprotein alcohol dehydrogenase, partial [Thermoleophilia bacterium]|nr:quinonprotein alcohol dehydrogenase [Thermoleophilia bacterium]
VAFTACGSDSKSKSDNSNDEGATPTTAPSFKASQLTKLPRQNWITNGGTISNDRYSPLDEINDGNVAQLKGDWKVDLQSGTEAKYSHEEQPIVYNGVIYVPTGEDDVFAFDAATGKQKWKYEGNLDPNISTVCCGWESRGVAIGEGKIYIGKLDGHMVALDQATGKVEWDVEVANWKKDNAGITAAPLYYDGKIYTGITGGEFGVRGRLTALDAGTGKELWRFYSTAGPDQDDNGPADKKGSTTWAGDSYLHGGAPIWQTPTVDPKLGYVYFTTGNANPDVDGSDRAGDNLYASSFVALDAETGKYKWHFQTVHHDIWDYDQPSPTLLYTAKVDGKKIPAIAEAAKTGWLYVLKRKTGEPIWGAPETKVPQDAQQKTSPTQPIPTNPPFADHTVSAAELTAIQGTLKSNPAAKGIAVKSGPIFTPNSKAAITVSPPGATGGTNWPPSSYNHETNMIYVCGLDGVSGFYPSGTGTFEEGAVRLGSILTALPFGETPGHLTAINGDTGEIAWKVNFPDSCYSGSVTTAGNLVFVGRNTGELEAYTADKGVKKWSFQTGAGANSTVTPFELDGKEKIAFVAGGNSLAASPHGDNLWVFSLDGELEQLSGVEGNAVGTAHAGESAGDAADTKAAEAAGGTGKTGQDDAATPSDTGAAAKDDGAEAAANE